MALGSDQISLPGQGQSISTVIASSNATGTMSSNNALGSNATQKIIVMSPSQAGQVQVVQQPPQASLPPTSQ